MSGSQKFQNYTNNHDRQWKKYNLDNLFRVKGIMKHGNDSRGFYLQKHIQSLVV